MEAARPPRSACCSARYGRLAALCVSSALMMGRRCWTPVGASVRCLRRRVSILPEGIHDFRSIIRDLAAQQKTVFLSSHLLAEVDEVCTHVIVINKGRVIRQLDVAALARTGVLTLGAADPVALRNAVLAYPGTGSAMIVDGMVVAELSDSDPAQLNRFLMESGVPLTEMTQRRQTVEDAFLAAMRNSDTDKEMIA